MVSILILTSSDKENAPFTSPDFSSKNEVASMISNLLTIWKKSNLIGW
jgi:hypothetical protein